MTTSDQDDPRSAPAPAPLTAPPERRRRRLRRHPESEEFVEVKPDASPLRKLIAILLVFGVVIGALVGGAYWWYRRQVNPPGPPGRAVAVVISSGTSTSGIANQLEHDGIIGNKTVFTFYVRRKKAGPFEAGRFMLRKNSDFDSVIRVLERGPVAPQFVRVNIPEGLTVAEIAAKLHAGVPRFSAAEVFQILASSGLPSSLRPQPKGSWEGLLFPASYDIGSKTGLTTVLSQMAAKMDDVTQAEGIGPASAAVAKAYGIRLTPYQALIVASLVQREAGSAEEAPKVATVIYNRLHQNIALGIDATSRFLAQKTKTKLDFSSPSPFNTRRRKGLPPTPIAAPSQASIHAALHPATGPWIYYVLTAPGKHTFAVTTEQFLAAKRICEAKHLGCG